MHLRATIIVLLVIVFTVSPVMADQSVQNDTWRAFAERLDPGAFVTVHLKNGRRVSGYFIELSGETITLNPKTRVPVPLRHVAVADVYSIATQKEGMSPGAKVLLATGISFGTLMVLITALLAGD